jgi:hypothetical protein
MRPIVLALAVTALAPFAASAQSLAVKIDQVARLSLPRPALDVMVGNPAIADVTVLDGRHLAITGKSFGVTNLLVTDAHGRPMFNRQIVIADIQANHVQVYRGADLYNYSCAPQCERQPMTGEPDSGGVYSRYSSPSKDYESRSSAAAGKAGANPTDVTVSVSSKPPS